MHHLIVSFSLLIILAYIYPCSRDNLIRQLKEKAHKKKIESEKRKEEERQAKNEAKLKRELEAKQRKEEKDRQREE